MSCAKVSLEGQAHTIEHYVTNVNNNMCYAKLLRGLLRTLYHVSMSIDTLILFPTCT